MTVVKEIIVNTRVDEMSLASARTTDPETKQAALALTINGLTGPVQTMRVAATNQEEADRLIEEIKEQGYSVVQVQGEGGHTFGWTRAYADGYMRIFRH